MYNLAHSLPAEAVSPNCTGAIVENHGSRLALFDPFQYNQVWDDTIFQDNAEAPTKAEFFKKPRSFSTTNPKIHNSQARVFSEAVIKFVMMR
jgi:hypothetical protein